VLFMHMSQFDTHDHILVWHIDIHDSIAKYLLLSQCHPNPNSPCLKTNPSCPSYKVNHPPTTPSPTVPSPTCRPCPILVTLPRKSNKPTIPIQGVSWHSTVEKQPVSNASKNTSSTRTCSKYTLTHVTVCLGQTIPPNSPHGLHTDVFPPDSSQRNASDTKPKRALSTNPPIGSYLNCYGDVSFECFH
jgi:hypothetical protein